jgi:Zn-finger nucleic acid-binding protein
MATSCPNCSAALAGNTGLCDYCGTYVGLDLHAAHISTVAAESERHCPHCEIPMRTVDLSGNDSLHVEHCESCHGLFFDNGELKQAMEEGVSNAAAGDRELINQIVNGRYQQRTVKYVSCPVCLKQMARRNFGYRSGVVTDICPQHGVWLDNGELRQLLEWKKAGGEEMHQRRDQLADARRKNKQRKPVAANHRPTGRDALTDDVDFGGLGGILGGLIRLFS